MITDQAPSRSHVAQAPKTEYVRLTALVAMLSLLIGMFAVVPRAAAQASSGDPSSDRYQAMVDFYVARGIDLGSASYLAKGQVKPDLVRKGIEVDAARYQAMGDHYLGLAADPVSIHYRILVDYYVARGIDPASASLLAAREEKADGIKRGIAAQADRYQAMGKRYLGLTAATPSSGYEAMVGFYLERGIDLKSARSLAQGQLAAGSAASGAESALADNPELLLSRAFVAAASAAVEETVACFPSDVILGENPELAYVHIAQNC